MTQDQQLALPSSRSNSGPAPTEAVDRSLGDWRRGQTTVAGMGGLIALAGQVWLYVTPIDPTVAVPAALWLTLLGVGLFASAPAWRLQLKGSGRWPTSANRYFFWVLASLLLSGIAAVAAIAFEQRAINQYLPILTIWLLGVGCYIIAWLPARLQLADFGRVVRENRGEALLITLIGVMAVGLRFYELGSLPVVVNGDEGLIGMFAQATSDGSLANPFALWENIGTLYLHLINAAMRAFGPAPFALRLLPAIGGSLAVLTTYLLGRALAGRQVASIAALLLAVSHLHLHFSRTSAVTYIQGTWMVPLELYLLLTGMRHRSSWRAALGGVVLAIHMNVYISAQIVTGILIIFTLILAIGFRSDFRATWRQIAVFWGGFAIAVIPQASNMLRRPEELLNRLNAEGTLTSGWLANQVAYTGQSEFQILAGRVAHAFLSLIYYPAIDFYGSPIPVLSFVAAVLFLLGLGHMLLRVRSLEGLLLNGYFWGMTVAVGVFAIPPSADSYRMIVALPPAMILVGIGLRRLLELLNLGWDQDRLRYGTITGVVLSGLVAINLWTYFFDFAGRCRYGGDTQTRFASHLGAFVGGLESEGTVYLLSDANYFYGSHASTTFLSRQRTIVNVDDSIDTVQPVQGETIVASPARVDELTTWARNHPGGSIHHVRACNSVVVTAYQVP